MGGECRLGLPGGFEVVVPKGGVPKSREDRLVVPAGLLDADARYGVAGEVFAGVLLVPARLECPEGLRGRVEGSIAAYRSRVVVEQAYDLYARMGPLAGVASVDPAYFPLSRMNLLWRLHGRVYAEYLEGERALEELRGLYGGYALDLGSPIEEGRVKLRAPRLRESFKSVVIAVRRAFESGLYRVQVAQPPWRGEVAQPRVVEEPWSLIEPPEGSISLSCTPPPEELGGDCRPAGILYSVLLCDVGGRQVAVKDYYRAAIKWVPAGVASRVFNIKYRLTPKARMASEAYYLPRLREYVGTPRVLRLCSDYRQAYMIREYVEGEPLSSSRSVEDWRLVGEALAAIHEGGYALGDPNPGNFLLRGGRPWLLDAEQARRYTRRAAAWDLVVALVYSRVTGVGDELLKAFVEAYASSRPRNEWGEVKRLALSPLLWLSLGVVAVDLAAVRRAIRDAPA